MARLASQQSQNPQMRALSERIMRDHTRMNAELVKISERRHAERASPPVMVKGNRADAGAPGSAA